MKNLVSIAALALAIASTPAMAQDMSDVVVADQKAPTVADAEAFIAAAEKDLFDFTVEASKVQWINATYITDDTDAMAAIKASASATVGAF